MENQEQNQKRNDKVIVNEQSQNNQSRLGVHQSRDEKLMRGGVEMDIHKVMQPEILDI